LQLRYLDEKKNLALDLILRVKGLANVWAAGDVRQFLGINQQSLGCAFSDAPATPHSVSALDPAP
jgi:hypothetical protein